MSKVSVVISCYNLGASLDEAVNSVLAQTFTDYEIIIVNDGSTDPPTCQLLSDYSKPKTRVFHIENSGVAVARNKGIEEASGEYILPLDADDRIGRTYLEKTVEVLEQKKNVGIVYCHCELFGAVNGKWNMPSFSLPHQLMDNLIFSAAMFRKADWKVARGYDPALQYGWEDWDFWLSLLENGTQVFRLPDVLFYYRIRPNSRERSINFIRRCFLMLKIVRKHYWLYLANCLKILMIVLGRDRRRPEPIRLK